MEFVIIGLLSYGMGLAVGAVMKLEFHGVPRYLHKEVTEEKTAFRELYHREVSNHRNTRQYLDELRCFELEQQYSEKQKKERIYEC